MAELIINDPQFRLPEEFLAQNFQLLTSELLGYGQYANVHLVVHKATGFFYALKIAKSNVEARESLLNEIVILVRLINSVHVPKLTRCNQTKILFEYIQKGTLFKLLQPGRLPSEILSRTIARQLYIALVDLHSNNVYHFDLKPENIMFTADYQLKICDFGFANRPLGGTKGYIAPELYTNQAPDNTNRDYSKCDVYSFGVIIFILVMGFPPYKEIGDHWYNLTVNWEEYWISMTRASGLRPPESFKILIQQLMEVNPNKRMKLSDIKDTEWFNGEIVDIGQFAEEFKKRESAVAYQM